MIICFSGFLTFSQAQTSHLNGSVGLGYARFISDMDLSGLNQNGFAGSLKIMWKPEYLLRVGLETGYYRLYSFEQQGIATDFGTADVSSSLSAMPIFVNWAMQVLPAVEIFAGIGPTFLFTSFESFGTKAETTQISTSYAVGATYTRRISETIELGGELKYYRINKIEDGTLSLQFVMVYKLLDW